MTATGLSPSAPTAPGTPPAGRWRATTTVVVPVLAALALAGAVLVSVLPLTSRPAPSGDVVAGFPVARAEADLATVAATPHPLGTPAQARVERFLIGELRGMGLDPQVQAETVTLAPDAPNSVWTAPVRNVVVRLPGTGPDHADAVMIAAHYDSVPTAPGAGDNGAGVVAVLETMRVLSAGPPPDHDVIAVFSDGEEHEMLGSRAFVDSSPWIHDARVVLNTEGIGNAGRVTPALSTARNGWVLGEYLRAADAPVVYTALDAPLNALDGGADLGRYQEVVPAGLEFSIIGGLSAYHAGTDTAAALNRGTLGDYGTTMLNLTRRLAGSDLRHVSATDLVAFTVAEQVTVAYPASWSLPLAVAAVLAVIGVLAWAVRRRVVGARRVVTAWLGLGAAVLAGLATGTGAWLLARAVDPRLDDVVNGGSYHRVWFALAACAAGLAAMLLVAWPLRRRHSGLEVLAGGLVGTALFGLLLAITLPAAAYVATWPALAGAAAFAFLARRPRPVPVQVAVGTLAALPAVVLLAPLVVVYFMLAARFELTMGIVATPLPLLWLLVGLAVVVPLVTVARRRISWRPAAAAAGLALALIATGAVVDANDTSPRPDALVYTLDADTGTARWVALPGVDGYTGQVSATGWRTTTFEADPFHRVGDEFAARTAPAPGVPTVAAPSATVVTDVSAGGARRVTLRAQAPAGGYALAVDLSAAGGVRAVTVDGTEVPDATDGRPGRVRVAAFSPSEAVSIEATVGGGRALDVRLTSYRVGFPDGLPSRVAPRTGRQTAGVYEVPDATVVTHTLTVPASS